MRTSDGRKCPRDLLRHKAKVVRCKSKRHIQQWYVRGIPGTFQSQWYRYAVPVRHVSGARPRNAIHLCEKRYFFISYIVFHTLYVVYTESNAGTIHRLQRVFFYFSSFILLLLLLLFSHHTYALSFFCFCCPFFVVGLSLPAYLLLLLELVAKSNK